LRDDTRVTRVTALSRYAYQGRYAARSPVVTEPGTFAPSRRATDRAEPRNRLYEAAEREVDQAFGVAPDALVCGGAAALDHQVAQALEGS
jgi:hypothetical protein